MSNTDTTTTATTTTTTPAAWHSDVPADIVSKWQTKGYDLSDPKKVAVEATKAYVSAESLVGLPTEQLLRLPKTPADQGWDKVWQRLGAPDKPEGYDFSGIKFKDGTDLDAAFTDMVRAAASTLHLPKDAAAGLTKAFVDFMDKQEASDAADMQGKLTEQQTALKNNWGKNYDAMLFKAKTAASALGATKEQIDALQGVLGYDKVMDMFAQIATKIGEDKFIDGGGPRGEVLTKTQAKEKLDELKRDKAWAARYLSGDRDAVREHKALATIIAGDDTEESRARGGR